MELLEHVLRKDTERRVLTELYEMGSYYASFEELEKALLQVLVGYAKELPVEYDSIDMLIWGRRHGWVIPEDGMTFRIQIPE